MPIVITNTNFFADQFNTGTTNVFQGNDGDTINVEIDFHYENTVDADQSPSLKLSFVEANVTNSSSQYFGNAVIDLTGFGIGQFIKNEYQGKEITISNTKAAYNGTANVVQVNGNFLVLDISYQSGGGNNFATGTFYVSSAIQAFEFEYSYDRSNDSDYSGALTQPNTTETQKLITSNGTVLDHTSTTPVSLIFNTIGAWNIGTATIEGTNLGVTGRQGFKLKQTLTIIPLSDADDSQYAVDYSNAFKFKLLPKETFNSSNPFQLGANNTIQTGIVDSGQIKVGFLDTNFGLTNINYSISNLSIIRTSDSKVSGIPIVEEKFTVSFDVENTLDTPFSNGNTKVAVSIENKPDTRTSTTQNYIQKHVYDTALTTLNAAAISGTSTGDAASITNYTATFMTSSIVSISFDVDFTANAQTQILANSTPEFAITCSTQNHIKNYGNSDRVNLVVFEGTGINKLLEDPVEMNATTFVTAPYTSITDGAANIDGFPGESVVGTTSFTIDWTDRSGLRLNTITQSLVLKDSSDGDEIELDKSIIPVSSALPLINGESPDAGELSQGTNFNINKGFKIPSGEIRNNIVMSNDNSTYGSNRDFFLGFPFFIRWEEYTPLAQTNVPSELIDNTKPSNGINYFVNRYDTIANWDVYYRLRFESTESGQTFDQTFEYKLTTTDYEAHTNIISRSIVSKKEDKTTSLFISGTDYIESTEKTFIEASFEFSVGNVPATTAGFDIELWIEIFENGSPTKIQRISSVNNLLTGSWWTDTGAGDGLVEKDISGDFAIGRAYINNVTLDKTVDNYRIYADIFSPQTPFSAKTTGDGSVKTTGSGYIKTVGT